MKTVQLAVIAFLLGLGLTVAALFPLRFLVVAYQHGGFW